MIIVVCAFHSQEEVSAPEPDPCSNATPTDETLAAPEQDQSRSADSTVEARASESAHASSAQDAQHLDAAAAADLSIVEARAGTKES